MNTPPRILFVDDEPAAAKYFQMAINPLTPVVTAGTVEEGKRLLDQYAESLAVLVSDQRMPGGYGNELLHYAQTRYPDIVRILTTAYSELDNTIDAVNQGSIHRYIRKPWDLPALKTEMKQALELSTLRKEHAQLLREKLMVQQMQTVSNRIGALYMLCSGLAHTDAIPPLENYLAAATAFGLNPSEPDWRHMDYADLVSAEAFRSAGFAHTVQEALAGLSQRWPEGANAHTLSPLGEIAGVQVQTSGEGAVLPADSVKFSEFLEGPATEPVSAQHAAWLAYLVWLHNNGKSLTFTQAENSLQCRPGPAASPITAMHLTEWIARLGEPQP